MTEDRRVREGLDELSRQSDRIVNLILYSSLPRVDIEIQIEQFREECLRRYPGSEDLFEMVYASRFRRIWQQWEKERPQDEGDFEAV
ncbi:MAG: hypothetical protein NTX87_04285 [Planctomycetota bacterium]|nr:hypothetical protein [Planctomycetota bacterium]